MISPHKIPLIVFSEETSIFFSPKKLYIAYKLTSQTSKPLGSVYIVLVICSANEWSGFFRVGTSVMKNLKWQIIFLLYTFSLTRYFLLDSSWNSDNTKASDTKNKSKSLSVYLRELWNICTKMLQFHYFVNMGLFMHACVFKSAMMSKYAIFYLLWHNVIHWSSHIYKKYYFLWF